jgi:hypothetical protein
LTIIVEQAPLPVTAEAGIPGLGARHVWRELVTLGEWVGYPRYKLRTIEGLHSLPDIEDLRDTPQSRIGEIPRPGRRRGKTIAYSGVVLAQSSPSLREAVSGLGGALAGEEELPEGKMRIVPVTGSAFYYWARVAQFSCDEAPVNSNRPSRGWERGFTLALRLSDPRFYREPAAPTVSSAGTYPQTVTVTNEGTAPTDPILTWHGPATNPYVTRDGKWTLRFNIVLASGQSLVVDFAKRQALQVGADKTSTLDHAASNWWNGGVSGLPPGASSLQFGADTIASPAKLDVDFSHAYWS